MPIKYQLIGLIRSCLGERKAIKPNFSLKDCHPALPRSTEYIYTEYIEIYNIFSGVHGLPKRSGRQLQSLTYFASIHDHM